MITHEQRERIRDIIATHYENNDFLCDAINHVYREFRDVIKCNDDDNDAIDDYCALIMKRLNYY
jgi:hypothetical protein